MDNVQDRPVTINLQYNPERYQTQVGIVHLLLMTVSEDGKVIEFIEKQPYIVSRSEDSLSFVAKEPTQSINIALTFKNDRRFNFSAQFDYSNNDRFLLLKSVKFIKSFNYAKKLKILDTDKSNIDIFDIPAGLRFDVENLLELINSIAIIENYTGAKFKIPSDAISYVEFLKLQLVSKIIDTKLSLKTPLKLVMNKQQALKLLKSYEIGEINANSILRYNYKADILGEQIIVQDVILNLATVRPAEDLTVLHKSILRETSDLISITFVNTVDDDTLMKMHIESVRKLHIIPLHETQFPNDVKTFIKEQNLPRSVLGNISLTILNIEKFLMGQGLKFDITTAVFIDREYPDWKEIEVVIRINRDLKFIYENLKPKIYDIVHETITSVLSNKLMINFKTL